jgi:hypothetical protein
MASPLNEPGVYPRHLRIGYPRIGILGTSD